MGNLALKNDVANDKKYLYRITLEQAKDCGMSAKGILKMVLLDMDSRYPFLYPSRTKLCEWTEIPLRTLENKISELIRDGWMVRCEDELGRKGFQLSHRISEKVHQNGEKFHRISENSHYFGELSHDFSESLLTDPVRVSHRSSETHYISKDLIKDPKEIKEREEHPSGAVASLPRPSASDSDFSSEVSVGRVISETETTTEGAGLSKTETVGVAEGDFGNLDERIAEAVRVQLEKSALSHLPAITGSETRTTPQQGQEGAKMEPTEAAPPVVSKPKAPKATRPARLGIEDEIPEAERQIALSQLAEWLPTLQIKQDFRTEKLGKALQAFVIRRREKYLKRIKGFEEPLTRLGLQCQLTKAQKWGYEKCLESIWTAAGEGWKGFFEPRPTNQNGTYKTFKQLDEERAEESLKAWAERKQAEVKH